jgi:hypothetical protein
MAGWLRKGGAAGQGWPEVNPVSAGRTGHPGNHSAFSALQNYYIRFSTSLVMVEMSHEELKKTKCAFKRALF